MENKECRICRKKMTSGEVSVKVFEGDYCRPCFEANGEKRILARQIAEDERAAAVHSSMAEESIRKLVLKKIRFASLQWTDRKRFELDRDSFRSWQKRIAAIDNRGGRIEVTFDRAVRKYRARVYQFGKLLEERTWNEETKAGIREYADRDSKIEIPWTEIQSGLPWAEDVRLSRPFLDEVTTPRNVIPFDFGRLPRKPIPVHSETDPRT